MKQIEINKGSWHYRLARHGDFKLTKYDEAAKQAAREKYIADEISDDEYWAMANCTKPNEDFCEYIRCILKALIGYACIGVIFGLIGGLSLVVLIGGPIVIWQHPYDWVNYLFLIPHVVVLICIPIVFHQKRQQDLYRDDHEAWLAKQKPPKPRSGTVSFLINAYKSIKNKTCYRMTIK